MKNNDDGRQTSSYGKEMGESVKTGIGPDRLRRNVLDGEPGPVRPIHPQCDPVVMNRARCNGELKPELSLIPAKSIVLDLQEIVRVGHRRSCQWSAPKNAAECHDYEESHGCPTHVLKRPGSMLDVAVLMDFQIADRWDTRHGQNRSKNRAVDGMHRPHEDNRYAVYSLWRKNARDQVSMSGT